MTKVCVFVPSHIHYDKQLDYLQHCLRSLLSQTFVPDIYVSISFENQNYNNDFDKKILNNDEFAKIVFEKSTKRLFQMEHIYNLTLKFANNYKLIMFCDDDDTYNTERVSTFVSHFLSFQNCLRSNQNIVGVKEILLFESIEYAPEYWSYAVVPKILNQFFDRFKNCDQFTLLKHNFADMYLRYYLKNSNEHNPLFIYGKLIVNKKLYHYNDKNNDSICAKICEKDHKSIVKDNLIVCIVSKIPETYETIFSKCKNECRAMYLLSKKDKKEGKKIYNFCQHLFM